MYYDFIYKIILIGNSGSGKSSLLSHYISGTFNELYNITIGVDYATKLLTLNIEDTIINIKLQIWDTAGQEIFRSITRSYFRETAGALVFFDITDKYSFTSLELWINELRKNCHQNIQIILIGNKNDLREKRVISINEALNLAIKYNIKYVETCSKNYKHISEIFNMLTHKIYTAYKTGQQDGISELLSGIKYGNVIDKYDLIQSDKKTCCNIL